MPNNERYIAIHGHFYQPPRENPWLEAIEQQDSAYPYHDWNERINVECYGPNAASRILDGDNRILQIVNNYSRISFNFGPTLLQWMEDAAPDTYGAILEADRMSAERFSGHGSALAQAYNHIILPLANRRDKKTQVRWGIRDFENRFGRKPEGLWLPETAVDLETLEILAEEGVRFTILSPHQAHSESGIDPTRAYVQTLPSGSSIAIFFYDGPVSRAVAFEGLLRKGEDFAGRLLSAFTADRDWPQLVHIATDGETYGHHHRFGDMALAYALHHIEAEGLARLTNYGEYLDQCPPTQSVEIRERTSWSCAHGIERWRENCGCVVSSKPGWTQEWRAPLRAALDYLRDALAPPFEETARDLFRDPWTARDEYIDVILDRAHDRVSEFLARNASRPLTPPERTVSLKLLELQRHALLMYTSCGWFFDDVTNIETVQVIQYAGRALQLAREVWGETGVEAGFLQRLERARSNKPEAPNGRGIYEKQVGPAAIDLEKMAAHYALSSLFEDYPPRSRLYCYSVERLDRESFEAGPSKLVVGRARLSSEMTWESGDVGYAALYVGDRKLEGRLKPSLGSEDYRKAVAEIAPPFARVELARVREILDGQFGAPSHSLASLFRDEQRKIVNGLLEETLSDIEVSYRQIHEKYRPLWAFVQELDMRLPRVLSLTSEFVLNTNLRRAFETTEVDPGRVGPIVRDVILSRAGLDKNLLPYVIRRALERAAARWAGTPFDLARLRRLKELIVQTRALPLEVDLAKVENLYYAMAQSHEAELREKARQGDDAARAWCELFLDLGEILTFCVSR